MTLGVARLGGVSRADPKSYWGESLLTTPYLHNKEPTKAIVNGTPFEYGQELNLISHILGSLEAQHLSIYPNVQTYEVIFLG